LALVLGVVTSVWLATVLLTWLDARHELDELLDGHLAQAAAILVVQQEEEVHENEHGLDAPSLHPYAPKVAFQVFHEGRLVMRSANAPLAPMASAGAGFRSGFETVQLAGSSWRIFAAYGAQRDIQVYVGEESASRASILLAVLRSTLLPMGLALPLLTLVLWWAIHRSVAPMRQLGRSLERRRPDALETLVVDGAPKELIPMIDALNSLFNRIGMLLESERRFTADASHELRTPIAAIRTQAQVALAESDDGLRRHALKATLAGCDRAIRLVDQLLTLSRLEAAALPTQESVDLAILARRVAADLAPKAIGKGQTVEVEVEPDLPCTVRANEALIGVLVRNLIDNALRYSPPQARVAVSVGRSDGALSFRVEDSGPGMSAADLGRLGERFFRVMGSGESGSGLGWSIVRRIAVVHDLEIDLTRPSRFGGLGVAITGWAH
jgi:two-component system sensor histidine kinase QseC